MSHTPGKLVVAEHTDERCAIRSTTPVAHGLPGKIVADVGYSGYENTDATNARRLVACWNACDGVPTDALEQIDGLAKAVLPYHQIKAQRDELLHALHDMLAGWQYIRRTHGDLYGVGWDRAENKAVAAIAKAEGTTP